MNAKEFLAQKGVHNLDTKKRYNEVIAWMEEYAALRQPPVSGSASQFEEDAFKLINAYVNEGLSKPDLVRKMKWIIGSCEMS